MRVGAGRLTGPGTARFTFDGRAVEARAGDTVAAALLAEGTRLMGRSFKYHRPRGVMTAGSEEPNALLETGRGARQVPNVRATVQEVWDGLETRSQNRWPGLDNDLLAVNDLLAPFLSAGFYYKTFMWPRRTWERLYEPAIRRAAGLGALSREHAPDAAERAFAFCDVLVIGAGPAGLMAALAAAEAGARVILATEEVRVGGRLLSEVEEVDGRPGHVWAEETARRLAGMGVRVMTRTAVTGAYDGGTYGALERTGLHRAPATDLPTETFWRIAAGAAVMATGAIERHVAFADNDRPGIMTASAVRAHLHRFGVLPADRIAVFGNNDDAWRTARDALAAGAEVTLIDSRPGAAPGLPCDTYAGARVTGTEGRRGLTEVTVSDGAGSSTIRVGCLAVSGGWNPSVHLACHMNGRPEWREDIAAFVPRSGMVPGLFPAGAANGAFSTAGCLADGLRAAREALREVGRDAPAIEAPAAEDGAYACAPLWVVEPGRRRAWLDHQNDVTVKDVRLAAREGFSSVELMKRYTTQGMAPDQGKSSNVAALAILADATGRDVPGTGTTTFRPPFVPVSIGAMGAGASGHGFAPERRTTSHEASVRAGAPMIEAGLWYRPSYFPAPGETTWREACDREVRTVREAVGVCDVSTLGKIDLQGPGAAALLDLVYCNTFSTLKEGRVRYGLMLREDGHVMDDGTAARLGPEHYVMTTTTAAAGEVMRHLEFVAQVLRPDLDVALSSVTEQWAQFAVAGPRARGAGGAAGRAPRGRRLALHGVRRGHGARRARPPVPHLVLGRARLRGRGARPLRRRALGPARRRRGRGGRRPLRHGGAQRPADREGLPHPCGDPRPHHRLRPRHGPHGEPRQGLHRPRRRLPPRPLRPPPRAARRPAPAPRRHAHRRGAPLRGRHRGDAAALAGLRHLRRALADAGGDARPRLPQGRPGAARRAGAPRRPDAGRRVAGARVRSGVPRPRGGADAWLTSSPGAPARGASRWPPAPPARPRCRGRPSTPSRPSRAARRTCGPPSAPGPTPAAGCRQRAAASPGPAAGRRSSRARCRTCPAPR